MRQHAVYWALFLCGFLLGLATLPALSVLFPAAPSSYVLTRDVPIDQYFCFRADSTSPVQGVLKKGSEFTLEARKGTCYYLAFQLPVDGPAFSTVCQPVHGSQAFLAGFSQFQASAPVPDTSPTAAPDATLPHESATSTPLPTPSQGPR